MPHGEAVGANLMPSTRSLERKCRNSVRRVGNRLGSNNAAVAVVLIIALSCGQARAAGVYVTGVGLKTCGEWASNPTGPIVDWISGYSTGLNEA